MRRGRLMAAAASAILIAAPAAWYFGSPWWTLWQMREAARARDLTTLAGYVDMPAVRRQAVRDWKTVWASVLVDIRTDNPSGRRFVELARRKLANPPTGGIGDIGPWIESIPIRFAGLGGGGGDSSYRPYIVHRGLDGFEVREEGASLEHGSVLTFRRHGLGWKLSGVRWGQQ